MPAIHNQDIAEEFVTSNDYKKNLMYHIEYDLFYLWQGTWYKPIVNHKMQKLVWNFIRAKFPGKNVTKQLVGDIVAQIKWACLKTIDKEDTHYLSLKDKILNLINFQPEEISKDKMSTFYLPFHYDELSTETPHFNKFLETSIVKLDKKTQEFVPDKGLINLVQEMFGFFLLGNMKGASAFFLVGGGANGKSVMADILKEMFTKEFCSAMSIQTLTTNLFSTPHLIGKKINISAEEESKFMQADKFKALVTGDMVSAERKFGEQFEFEPTTKYLFASNKLPTFAGMDYGLKRRIKIIPFLRTFKGDKVDHNLIDKIKKERAGIIAWAIKGAERFVKHNYTFSKAKASTEAMIEFESEISGAVRFVRENYEVDDDVFISNDDLYSQYREWCSINGKKPMSSHNFARDITQNIQGVKSKTGRVNDTTKRGKNIRLVTDFDNIMRETEKSGKEEIDVEQIPMI
ncbi:MAG: hypothetical protein HF967_08670 [Methanosarcinales archaeon]|nr:hypothetical protein [Methanosarcinales archaeon]